MSTPPIRSDKIHRPRSNQSAPRTGEVYRKPQPGADFSFGANLDKTTPQPRVAGLAGLVADSLGPVELPTAFKLISALENASSRVERAESAVPGLSDLVRTVLDDEIAKINRYIDISGG